MDIELYLNKVERLYKAGYSIKQAIEIVEGWIIEDARTILLTRQLLYGTI
jgi:hypothetical protein